MTQPPVQDGEDLQGRVVRALAQEYEQRVERHLAAGLEPDAARGLALAEVKVLGGRMMLRLRLAGWLKGGGS